MFKSELTLSTPDNSVMEISRSEFNVVDVYELATKIGREFEELIEVYGPESIGGLMPQVITCLEHLEVLASQNQNEQVKITELNLVIDKLTDEKQAKAKERYKYEQELETIEESWRKDTNNLLDQLAQLKRENTALKTTLNETKGQAAKVKHEEAEEMKLMVQLKEKVDEQQKELRKLKHELSSKSLNVTTLQSQLERMARLTADYKRKTNINQKQAVQLISDKTHLQAELHDKEKRIQAITCRLEKQGSNDGATSPLNDDEMTSLAMRLADEGKMVVDLDDPNRPRYSLKELEAVMMERNELKTKLIELEDDLAHYKKIEEQEELEPAVQGPINKEPDEKLYPDRLQNSRIRKLFSFFSPKPRSSTLLSSASSSSLGCSYIQTSADVHAAQKRRQSSEASSSVGTLNTPTSRHNTSRRQSAAAKLL